MSRTMPAIIAADIVGGNRHNNPSGPLLRRELVASLVAAAPLHSDVEDTEFGIRLILSDAREAYGVLKLLLATWMQAKSVAAAPLILGLKVGLHAGWNLTNSSERFMGWSTVGKAFRLAWAGNSDAVRMSERIYNLLQQQMQLDKVIPLRRTFNLDQEVFVDGVEVPITALLPSSQFRISVTPPDELMHYLAKNAEYLRVLDSRVFERVIGRLFEDAGYEVELRKQTRDHGIDLIAFRRKVELGLSERFLIQCKRYSEGSRVGVEAVRELAGVGAIEPNSGLVLVTTSSFSRPAREFSMNPALMWRLHLKDYSDLQAWLSAYAERRNLLNPYGR